MREIKFRGKNKKTGEWVSGFLATNDSGHEWIVKPIMLTEVATFEFIEIEKGSGCQFTGLRDKQGKEIYEGDIVKGGTDYDLWVKKKPRISTIEYFKHGFWVKDESFGWEGEGLWQWEHFEVIGNIYENHELLPEGGERKGE